MPSVDAAEAMADLPPVDLVYLDGSHDYASVCADIDAWLPRLRPGGRCAGHDAWQPDVRRALDDRLPGWTNASNHVWSYEVPA